MFCPSCGGEETRPIQFCRVCGTNLRGVRAVLDHPDAITASAISAREEIGRAIAARISTLERAKDLSKVAEEVLPEIEKFLEAPEERQLRRIRTGIMTAALGLGFGLFLLIVSVLTENYSIPWAIGFIPFLVGLALVMNGMLFTVPRRDGPFPPLRERTTGQLRAPGGPQLGAVPASVVDHTTELLEHGTDPSPARRDTH